MAVAVAALGFATLTACSHEKTEEPSVSVQIVPVENKTLHKVVRAEAILFPLQQSAIVPKIAAPVKTFYVRRGSKVRKGQLLAILENRDLVAATQESRGAYDQAEAAYTTTTAASLPEEIEKARLDVDANKVSLEAEQKVYDSRQELFQQGALPRKELDQASVNVTQARNQYEIAKRHLDALMAVGKQQELKSAAGQLESAKGKYLGSTAQLSYSEIRSPIDGVVTDRPLYAGEMTATGTPLITVMDLSTVVARAHIAQDQAALLKVGDKANITLAGLDDPVEGKVTVVSPALDPNSTTVEVWVEAKNHGQQLKPGSSSQLGIIAQTVSDTVVVPAAAILTAADGAASVMVVGSDSRAHQRAVKLGIRQDDNVQVVEGLKAGEKIVGTGAYGLPDNAKVTPEENNSPPESKDKPKAGSSDKDDK
jgi:multidrug efflux pump subunit AcrA (membrane-fusion protein)